MPFKRYMHVLPDKSRIVLSKMYANFKRGYKGRPLILHYYLRHVIRIIRSQSVLLTYTPRGDINRNPSPNQGTNPYTNANLKLQTSGLRVDLH